MCCLRCPTAAFQSHSASLQVSLLNSKSGLCFIPQPLFGLAKHHAKIFPTIHHCGLSLFLLSICFSLGCFYIVPCAPLLLTLVTQCRLRYPTPAHFVVLHCTGFSLPLICWLCITSAFTATRLSGILSLQFSNEGSMGNFFVVFGVLLLFTRDFLICVMCLTSPT